MNWDTYFSQHQRRRWQCLARGAAMEYVLRESVRDMCFLYELQAWFSRNAGNADSTDAFTARTTHHLIAEEWTQLATNGANGHVETLRVTPEEILGIVAALKDTGPKYFLVPTIKGRTWVSRYNELIDELDSRTS
jgi:hypothetical protein